MPQPIMHARDGVIATAHPTRKRSAAVALVAITLGVGATTYAAMSAGRNCPRDETNKDQTATCGQASEHWVNSGRTYSGSAFLDTSTPGVASTTPRRGFGMAGSAHMKAGG
ncbi:MAG: hypothetical protein ACLPID_18315 [Beijerinckiaceae bacterium]